MADPPPSSPPPPPTDDPTASDQGPRESGTGMPLDHSYQHFHHLSADRLTDSTPALNVGSGQPARSSRESKTRLNSVSLVTYAEQEHANAVDQMNRQWGHVIYDPLARIFSSQSCFVLTNLDGGWEHNIVAVDYGANDDSPLEQVSPRLRTFKGAQPFSDTPLQSLPCGLISFFPESALPNIPALALASGPSLFIYRNRRPYFKFTLPKVPANPLEEDVWQSIRAAPTHESGQIDPQCVDDAWKLLREIRESSTGELTNRTLLFLSMDDEISRIEFVQKVKDQPLTREPAITCIAAIKRHSKDEESMDCLIVGSEEKIVYILSPPNFTIVEKFQLSSPIVFVSARGLFQGNYTIVVVCRDGSLYRLKENACERLVQLEVQPLGLLVFEQSAIVACMNHCIYCYDYQGYRRFSILMPAAITCIEAFAHPSKRYVGYLVALENRHVRIYNGNILVSCILADGIVKAVRFGTFAREESCLVMLMTSGGLLVKRLKRSTELVSGDSVLRPPKEQNIPIPVPKKTMIFMEQSNRERDQATDLYRLFQHGLTKLRIQALKGYMQLESRSADPSGSSASLPVKLDANLLGLGPLYRLELRLENIGTEPLSNLAVHLRHSSRDIVPRCRGFQLPLLVPGLAYQLETDLHTAARDDSGGSFPNLAVPAPKLTVVVHGRGPGGPLLCAEVDLGAMACTHPPT